MKRFSSRLTIVAAALAAGAGSASAQTTECSGDLAPGTYAHVVVPANATCTLRSNETGTRLVTGNVTVERGATFIVPQDTHLVVNGSLLGRDAASITIALATVNILGSVHLSGTTNHLALADVSIGGSLFIADSTGFSLAVAHNNVGGSVLVRGNVAGSAIVVADNAIGGSLVCKDNTPAPSLNPPNTVGGNEVGQCASEP